MNDTSGHGTFVAGEIAAAVDNGRGIAGLSPSARLLIAKVVGDDGTVSPSVEAQAIRWVVARGARVVNVSLGGVRDPQDGQHSGFSPVEQRAIDYAVAQGALVVASVGNNPYEGGGPWPFAGLPGRAPARARRGLVRPRRGRIELLEPRRPSTSTSSRPVRTCSRSSRAR